MPVAARGRRELSVRLMPNRMNTQNEEVELSNLKADCARCQGLCCVASAFDVEQGFAFAKAARQACRHLDGGNRCEIHANLSQQGFPACVHFDCHGAGQHVCQQWFAEKSWRNDPKCAEIMFTSYQMLRDLNGQRALLITAESWLRKSASSKAESLIAQCQMLRAELRKLSELDLDAFMARDVESAVRISKLWLISLRSLG